ncbi:MAG TPA: hypothetical protein VM422_00965 [Amaricoccus sp.]|nr:hypothetical protein [Amaricoccus sp.]
MPMDGIALIGFGEAASTFLTGWTLGGSGRVRAYDLKLAAPGAATGSAGPPITWSG